MTLTVPHQLDRVCDTVLAQREQLEAVARHDADALSIGGGIHVYANGHSRIAVEEMIVRMGALTGFHPLVVVACAERARTAPPKHSSGQNLWQVMQAAQRGYFLDNGMPVGTLSPTVEGQTGTYALCPLSSIGVPTDVQSLNELTVRELDRHGHAHPVLRNMHPGRTEDNQEARLHGPRQAQ